MAEPDNGTAHLHNTTDDGAPTAAGLWPKLFAARPTLKDRFSAAPCRLRGGLAHGIGAHRRWATPGRFIAGPSVPAQKDGVIMSNDYTTSGVRGTLSNGLRGIVDNNGRRHSVRAPTRTRSCWSPSRRSSSGGPGRRRCSSVRSSRRRFPRRALRRVRLLRVHRQAVRQQAFGVAPFRSPPRSSPGMCLDKFVN